MPCKKDEKSKFSDSQIWQNNMFKDESIFFLYLLKYVCDTWEGYGSIFWPNVQSSRNHLKSIGKGLGTLIRRFGIIWTPNYHKKALKTRKHNKSHKFVCLMWSHIGALLYLTLACEVVKLDLALFQKCCSEFIGLSNVVSQWTNMNHRKIIVKS